jgi:hypothetical protein
VTMVAMTGSTTGATPGDWAAMVSAVGAALAAVAAIIAWMSPRGSGPTVGWDALRRRGGPTGNSGMKFGYLQFPASRDPDDILVRNVGWRTAWDVQIVVRGQVFSQVDDLGIPVNKDLVWQRQSPLICSCLDPNSGVAVPISLMEEGDTVVEVSWESRRWGLRRRHTWASAPLT